MIEHSRNPEFLIKEIRRILKTNGKLIIFTPPSNSTRWKIAERLHHFFTGMESGHVSPFTMNSLKEILEKSFRKLKIRRINFGLTICATAIK